ncbi:CPBP family intramembrane glutamic endopeptidase [Pseudonocardia humida]|uniref:CPBP family intramembrane metalloprotease n=1 Tax=Pseudonocardia humida TaxID=2800819 RepID=A0ABT1A7S1_9PSEU|nr:CPBP family intramembrane glutamic endopeptidase [Pseudonocardia humida]MCO1659062.1 CPBP family intramembrane metalloprotease [Pseudonocardia humida]
MSIASAPAAPRREVAVFLFCTFAGVWLVATPLLLGAGVDDPGSAPVIWVAMYTPALAALLARRRLRALLVETGVTVVRPARKLLVYCAVGLLLPPLLGVLALGPSVAAGAFAFHGDPIARTVEVLVPALAALPVLVVLVLGEEVGWSFLLPRLLPLGLGPALLVSGVVWGLFHAPFTLAGYHFPDRPGWLAVLCFTVASVLLGTLMAWLRLATGSIWPAVAAHASANGLALQIPAAFGAPTDPAGAVFDTTLAGWPGWVAMAVAVGVLLATGRLARAARTALPMPAR